MRSAGVGGVRGVAVHDLGREGKASDSVLLRADSHSLSSEKSLQSVRWKMTFAILRT